MTWPRLAYEYLHLIRIYAANAKPVVICNRNWTELHRKTTENTLEMENFKILYCTFYFLVILTQLTP